MKVVVPLGIGIGGAILALLVARFFPTLADRLTAQQAALGRYRALGVNVAVVLLVIVGAWLILQGWFTYNRAQDGENAWVCLHQPQAGCGIASPAPPPVSHPPVPHSP